MDERMLDPSDFGSHTPVETLLSEVDPSSILEPDTMEFGRRWYAFGREYRRQSAMLDKKRLSEKGRNRPDNGVAMDPAGRGHVT
eukprot:CAMPEP_0184501168 /NCGR_PEP_ID=MMETSP0113_2-20130426/46923_1 /TAXON_ID=91329 /ORGANISM="Norrisiella sphaerica, Strain BC52" /LENGTH=83 /DNA_ID=CAMNT_0026889835 /DNA_START=1 /DNA_END=248 /DNA_ORIENTATION=+